MNKKLKLEITAEQFEIERLIKFFFCNLDGIKECTDISIDVTDEKKENKLFRLD